MRYRDPARASRILAIAGLLFALAGGVKAETTITVSTNNTPLDRAALEALSKEAFHRVGAEVRFVSLPSERSLHAANQGEVDGEGLRIAGLSAQYPDLVQVPERYIDVSFVAFAKDPEIALDKGWESLKRHRVAFINGWKLFENQAAGAAVVNKVDKAEQMFLMLDGGRIDLALFTLADGVALTRSMGMTKITPLKPTLKNVDMYLYLNRKHEALAPAVARALREMKADGSYARILRTVKAK